MFDVKGKYLVLTGASGGLGSAIARELSQAGAFLLLVDRQIESVDALNKELDNKHIPIALDLSDQTQRVKLAEYCAQLPNGIDGIINNAGISDFSLLDNVTSQRIHDVININLISPITLCTLLLPKLRNKSSALILNIGSTFGSIGYPGFSLYASSKFGMRGFTESLRRELADSDIVVKYFAPRAAKTAINNDKVMGMNAELGTKMDTPEVVAKALMRFLTQPASQCYVGWPEKLFVKINSVFPKLVDSSIIKQLPIIKRYL
jgi:short-subunit dehydrogenase